MGERLQGREGGSRGGGGENRIRKIHTLALIVTYIYLSLPLSFEIDVWLGKWKDREQNDWGSSRRDTVKDNNNLGMSTLFLPRQKMHN